MESNVPNQTPLVVERESLPNQQTDGCSTATDPAMISPERMRQASDVTPNDLTLEPLILGKTSALEEAHTIFPTRKHKDVGKKVARDFGTCR